MTSDDFDTPDPFNFDPRDLNDVSPEEAVNMARNSYGNDSIEVDEDAKFSQGDSGCWVAAWVWINGINVVKASKK